MLGHYRYNTNLEWLRENLHELPFLQRITVTTYVMPVHINFDKLLDMEDMCAARTALQGLVRFGHSAARRHRSMRCLS